MKMKRKDNKTKQNKTNEKKAGEKDIASTLWVHFKTTIKSGNHNTSIALRLKPTIVKDSYFKIENTVLLWNKSDNKKALTRQKMVRFEGCATLEKWSTSLLKFCKLRNICMTRGIVYISSSQTNVNWVIVETDLHGGILVAYVCRLFMTYASCKLTLPRLELTSGNVATRPL